jgi:hypothetical protein
MKHTLTTLLFLILFNSYDGKCQTFQMKKWWIHNNVINTTNQTSVADIRSGTNIIGPSNSIYDKNLALKFYVSNNQVRSANGTLLITLNASFTCKEYSIVPFIGQDACSNEKYYVFYHSYQVLNFGLKYVVIQIDKNTGIASLLGGENTAFSGSLAIDGYYGVYGAIAVGKEINGKRFLYYISGNNNTGSVRKFEISKTATLTGGVSSGINIYNSPSILYNSLELDLSPDGSKLGWGASHETIHYVYGYALYLDNLGQFEGTLKQFLISMPSSNFPTVRANIVKGVEFNDGGNVLFLGFGNISSIYAGIFEINLVSNTIFKIPNSFNYSTSQIERGSDGRMYVGNTTSTGSQLNSFSQTSPYLFGSPINVPLQKEIITDIFLPTQYNSFLPDQIDGEDYDLMQNNLSPIVYDIVTDITLNGVNYWQGLNNNNPYSKPIINVAGSITVNGILSLENMNLKFNSSSNIEVDGGILFIDGSTLESINCAMMWPGIRVRNGGIVVLASNYGLVPTDNVIKDAVVGIDALGISVKIDVNHTKFIANESDIYLNNVASTNFGTINSLTPNILIRNTVVR